MTFEAATQGSAAPPEIIQSLELINVPFIDFVGQNQTGQIVVARELAPEIAAIFAEIYGFPIAHMTPLVAFDWSDDASMKANNCSGFNYRVKVGKTELSAHALGRAIDINPRQNPYICGEITLPPRAVYDATAVGTLLADGKVVRAFESRGWEWGGRWTSLLDYHHFEKPLR